MASTIENAIRNSMIIRADAIIPRSMAARIGITATAVQIVPQVPPGHRGRWAHGGRQVLKGFPESGARWVRKALRELPDPLVPRGLLAKQARLARKAPPV